MSYYKVTSVKKKRNSGIMKQYAHICCTSYSLLSQLSRQWGHCGWNIL